MLSINIMTIFGKKAWRKAGMIYYKIYSGSAAFNSNEFLRD